MTGLESLTTLGARQSRSISAENPDGSRGGGGRAVDGTGAQAAERLGRGWKVAPAVRIDAGATAVLADIAGPAIIRHIWMTCDRSRWNTLILRAEWDGEGSPSIEVPLGDFFANGSPETALVTSEPIAVLVGGGMNSYWPMPFRERARITIENRGDTVHQFFFQIDYTLEDVPAATPYLHAQWRRSETIPGAIHTILDGVEGEGHYVGTVFDWTTAFDGWWGEGEVRFFLDGDGEYPTVCGTGVEDYVGGAWCFEMTPGAGYQTYSSAYLGFHQALDRRFAMYRWHIPDPIRFHSSLKVDVQALGWGHDDRYIQLVDDTLATVALWYQREPHAPFPVLDAG
ncbi:glycoside hydrolase family 172 protein [Microbacterium insulae]|uniref:Glycoside hydrolase family 172 protein n=1 Tax=Microbacterium insulae TaxID=483014 RepID=A0ABW3AH86_9MICO